MKEYKHQTKRDDIKLLYWVSFEEPLDKTNFEEGKTNDSKKFWYTIYNTELNNSITFKRVDGTLLYRNKDGKVIEVKPNTKSSEKGVEKKEEEVEEKKEKVEEKKVEEKKERDSSLPPPMSELRKEAAELGVDSNLIEEARDSFDPQKELMRLIKYAEVGAGAEVYYNKYSEEMVNSIKKVVEPLQSGRGLINKDDLVNFINLAEELKNNSLFLKENIKRLAALPRKPGEKKVITESQLKEGIDQQIKSFKQMYFEQSGEQFGGKENTIKKIRRTRKNKRTRKDKRTRRGKRARRKK